jgi:hypothetical protein
VGVRGRNVVLGTLSCGALAVGAMAFQSATASALACVTSGGLHLGDSSCSATGSSTAGAVVKRARRPVCIRHTPVAPVVSTTRKRAWLASIRW